MVYVQTTPVRLTCTTSLVASAYLIDIPGRLLHCRAGLSHLRSFGHNSFGHCSDCSTEQGLTNSGAHMQWCSGKFLFGELVPPHSSLPSLSLFLSFSPSTPLSPFPSPNSPFPLFPFLYPLLESGGPGVLRGKI